MAKTAYQVSMILLHRKTSVKFATAIRNRKELINQISQLHNTQQFPFQAKSVSISPRLAREFNQALASLINESNLNN